jgi:catechol 2,3-dioxygenase-like lactoylglutathione lyase family enzyme
MNILVNLDVDDLEKAIRFYSSAFGLKVGRRFGNFGVEMLGTSTPIYLLAKSPARRPRIGPLSSVATSAIGRRSIWILSLRKSNPQFKKPFRLEPNLRNP